MKSTKVACGALACLLLSAILLAGCLNGGRDVKERASAGELAFSLATKPVKAGRATEFSYAASFPKGEAQLSFIPYLRKPDGSKQEIIPVIIILRPQESNETVVEGTTIIAGRDLDLPGDYALGAVEERGLAAVNEYRFTVEGN